MPASEDFSLPVIFVQEGLLGITLIQLHPIVLAGFELDEAALFLQLVDSKVLQFGITQASLPGCKNFFLIFHCFCFFHARGLGCWFDSWGVVFG